VTLPHLPDGPGTARTSARRVYGMEDPPLPPTHRHRPALVMDHASIAVPALPAAIDLLAQRYALELVPTVGAADRHGRIYLDRTYLEVSTGAESRWEVTAFYLGFSDLERLRRQLSVAGLVHRHQVYEGVDGRWDDVEVEVAEVPVPVLVRRTEPAELARNWPPPLERAHRCGATGLAEVHLPVESLREAAELYARLLGGEPSWVAAGGTSVQRRAVFHLGTGRIVLVEGASRYAAVLGVPSLATSRAVLGPALLPPDDRGVSWFAPAMGTGLPLGLVPLRSGILPAARHGS
jgi:hypothetical protein